MFLGLPSLLKYIILNGWIKFNSPRRIAFPSAVAHAAGKYIRPAGMKLAAVSGSPAIGSRFRQRGADLLAKRMRLSVRGRVNKQLRKGITSRC